MAQHLLDRVEISAVFQKMSGERMAQGVGGNLFADTGQILIVLDNFPKALPRHSGTVHIDEKGSFIRLLDQLRANMFNVISQRFKGG